MIKPANFILKGGNINQKDIETFNKDILFLQIVFC